jgi:hypothetical protein
MKLESAPITRREFAKRVIKSAFGIAGVLSGSGTSVFAQYIVKSNKNSQKLCENAVRGLNLTKQEYFGYYMLIQEGIQLPYFCRSGLYTSFRSRDIYIYIYNEKIFVYPSRREALTARDNFEKNGQQELTKKWNDEKAHELEIRIQEAERELRHNKKNIIEDIKKEYRKR